MAVLIAAFAFVLFQAADATLTDRMIAISDWSIHIRCGGERRPGEPTVILEAGGGNSADTWRDVHVPLAQLARVCAYDRPGLGSSTRPGEPLRADAQIQLLDAVLKTASEPGPYVLVGHSIGGVLAALYANAHTDRVVGMVLVDSSHEATTARFREAGVAPETTRVESELLLEALSRKPWRGIIPLVVLTRGRTAPNLEMRNKIWLELQRDWVTRSPNAKQIIATNSGHNIHNDEPKLVVDAVRWVLEQVAATGKRR